MNQTYLGPDRLPGTAGFQPSSGDLNGNTPTAAYALFNVVGGVALDSDGDGFPESTDLDTSGIDSFARSLTVAVTQPRDFAASRDQSGGAPVPIFPPGDGSNVEALARLQSTSLLLSTGSFSFTGTYGEAFTEMVGHVGGLSSRAKLSAAVAEDTKTAAISRREEVSGVSLDEEFTNLIKFQKVYEASARLIRVADELLDQLLSAL
jgi:flagellar hook-associated protein 1 FlgK